MRQGIGAPHGSGRQTPRRPSILSPSLIGHAIAPTMTWLALAMTVAACQTTGSAAIEASPAVAKAACTAFPPISWSRNDTLETQMAVRAHNAAWKAACGD